MTDSQGISTAKHPVLSDGQGMCTGKQQIPSGSSEAGPGAVGLPLRLVLGPWVLPVPCRALSGAEAEPSLQPLPCWSPQNGSRQHRAGCGHKLPKSSCLQGSAKCISLFDRGSEGACKWYFCKTSAACALSGVSRFIASRYSRYEVML